MSEEDCDCDEERDNPPSTLALVVVSIIVGVSIGKLLFIVTHFR